MQGTRSSLLPAFWCWCVYVELVLDCKIRLELDALELELRTTFVELERYPKRPPLPYILFQGVEDGGVVDKPFLLFSKKFHNWWSPTRRRLRA